MYSELEEENANVAFILKRQWETVGRLQNCNLASNLAIYSVKNTEKCVLNVI